MKHLVYLTVAAFALCTCGCVNAGLDKQQAEEKRPIPEGAVEMQYNHHLYFKVMLRDSIPARMVFDTGSGNLIIDSTFYAPPLAKASICAGLC